MRARSRPVTLFAAFLVLGAPVALGEPPGEAPHVPAKPRSDIPGLPNFAQVAPGLYRSGQPTAGGMREARKLGIKTVVNLRSFHSDRDELKGTGLRYAHVSMKAWHPEVEDVVAFLAIVKDPNNHPILVHCQHGADRTGMIVASYRVIVQGWTIEEALAELPVFGFHEIWKTIRKYLAKQDPETVRKALATAKPPEIDVVE